MAMDCHPLVCDQVKLSWFKVIEWCQGSVDPTETWWHGLIPKEFLQQRPPLDSKGILRSLHERLTSDVPYYHNCLWVFSMSFWLNEFFFSTVQVWNLENFLFFIFFKSKISHFFIHMGFIRLITWSGVRRLWKKGLERLKECFRVTLSKNLESVACTFWVGLYSFCLIH